MFNIKKQAGSVVIILVSIVSIIVLLLVIGNANILSKSVDNKQSEDIKIYLDNAENLLNKWYRISAAKLDNPNSAGICPDFTVEDILNQANIVQLYGIKLALTPCMQDNNLVYRDIAIWIPTPGVNDASKFEKKSGSNYYIFYPNDSQTKYKIISGKNIETKMIAETQSLLKNVSNMFEVRFKSKIENDPSHDIRINHLRSLNCQLHMGNSSSATNLDEIPCSIDGELTPATSDPITSGYRDGHQILTQDNFNKLLLAEKLSINENNVIDAWGQPIIFNNVLRVTNLSPIIEKDACVPNELPIPKPENPPYTMSLQSLTPWGYAITICPTQPFN